MRTGVFVRNSRWGVAQGPYKVSMIIVNYKHLEKVHPASSTFRKQQEGKETIIQRRSLNVFDTTTGNSSLHNSCHYRNKGGICIPNSTTGDLTVNDVDLFQHSNVTA